MRLSLMLRGLRASAGLNPAFRSISFYRRSECEIHRAGVWPRSRADELPPQTVPAPKEPRSNGFQQILRPGRAALPTIEPRDVPVGSGSCGLGDLMVTPPAPGDPGGEAQSVSPTPEIQPAEDAVFREPGRVVARV